MRMLAKLISGAIRVPAVLAFGVATLLLFIANMIDLED